MILSLEKNDFQKYLVNQIYNFFPDGHNSLNFHDTICVSSFDDALQRTEYCFDNIKIRGYSKNNNTYFNHLHMDQYSTFLYFFSNSLYQRNYSQEACSKLVLLNRALSSCWFSYKANFPAIFCLVHPVGSVIGHQNVSFSNYLVILQNVTINGLSEGELKLGKGLFCGAGSSIIGKGFINDYVSISAGTIVRSPCIEENRIVFRDDLSGEIKTKDYNSKILLSKYFKKIG